MDASESQFFITVARACEDAALARTPVCVIVTADQGCIEGIPSPPRPADERGLDDTGYEDGLRVGDRPLALHDVVELRLRRPGAAAPMDAAGFEPATSRV